MPRSGNRYGSPVREPTLYDLQSRVQRTEPASTRVPCPKGLALFFVRKSIFSRELSKPMHVVLYTNKSSVLLGLPWLGACC